MDDVVFLDANVFMYAAGSPHNYKLPCLHILAAVEIGNQIAVTNSEVLQEILYRYHHINLHEKGVQLCQNILSYPIQILPVTKTDVQLAINLLENPEIPSIKPRDAIHAATMKTNGIIHILSADRHFDQMDFIQRIDPLNHVIKKN